MAPATGREVGARPHGTREQTVAAITAASEALLPWHRLGPRGRGRRIRLIGDDLERRIPTLAPVLAAETGKRLAEAEGEIRLAAEFLFWFAEETRRAYGTLVPAPVATKSLTVVTRPRGPAALLVPWNFPVSILVRKLAAALAAGCTVVARPSSTAPLAALACAQSVASADLPPGAVNLISGSLAETADPLVRDRRIKTVSFTGSTEVGRQIARRVAARLGHTTLELGGDAPFIVFDDADLEVAVAQALIAKTRNNGQSCIALNRLYLQAGIADRFLAELQRRLADLVLGDPLDPATTLGPVISPAAGDRLRAWVGRSVGPRSTLIQGEGPVPGAAFVRPTIVVQPAREGPLERSEIFGPVAGAWVFRSESDGLARAARSSRGLAAYVMTRDAGRIARATDALHVGVIGVNDAAPTTPEAPFGGLGDSGWGKEGGRSGLAEYVDHTFVSLHLPESRD
jgi:succinate-semialdehyde dehydrogenase/glutarate-semialdehyde dehydrogenase